MKYECNTNEMKQLGLTWSLRSWMGPSPPALLMVTLWTTWRGFSPGCNLVTYVDGKTPIDPTHFPFHQSLSELSINVNLYPALKNKNGQVDIDIFCPFVLAIFVLLVLGCLDLTATSFWMPEHWILLSSFRDGVLNSWPLTLERIGTSASDRFAMEVGIDH